MVPPPLAFSGQSTSPERSSPSCSGSTGAWSCFWGAVCRQQRADEGSGRCKPGHSSLLAVTHLSQAAASTQLQQGDTQRVTSPPPDSCSKAKPWYSLCPQSLGEGGRFVSSDGGSLPVAAEGRVDLIPTTAARRGRALLLPFSASCPDMCCSCSCSGCAGLEPALPPTPPAWQILLMLSSTTFGVVQWQSLPMGRGLERDEL